MTGSYDSGLVLLSIAIAILASYAALNVAGHLRSASGVVRLEWLGGGAIVMGIGIWSMHFVGMMAFRLPVPIAYGVPLMLLSVVVAIGASILALAVVSGTELHVARLLSAGVLMGVAISGMHYIGMASMHGAMAISYRSLLVAASVVIAVAASLAALWAAFRFAADASSRGMMLKIVAAVVMGSGIAAMHYTGMAAARFTPAAISGPQATHVIATRQLGETVAAGALLMIVIALVGTVIDRRVLAARVALTERLAAQAAQLREQKDALEVQARQLETQAAELSRALAEAQRARMAEHEANAARVKFVNMASHELRTPIGAIGGYADLLLMNIAGDVPNEQRNYLARIQTNQRHLLRLINEMLDLAKLEAGQMPVRLVEVKLDDALAAAFPMIEPQLRAKDIRYSEERDENAPCAIGDPERVQQIIINLLANGIKFTPPAGMIAVSIKNRRTRIDLHVHDSGPGIAQDKIGSLFTPFVQLGNPDRKAEGTGLGLAISRELARAMGGDLEARSGEGTGATFVLSLRAAPAFAMKPSLSQDSNRTRPNPP